MTQREAVYKAIGTIGVRTSLKELADKATTFYKEEVSTYAACVYRSEYRKQKNILVDCRTYNGQPRRNMFKDEEVTLPQVKRLNSFFRNTKVSKSQLRQLIGDGKHKFHSVEQLSYAIAELEQLQSAA